MSKRATVNPRWLDCMLIGWGLASIRSSGWYTINPMLQDGIPTGFRSREPTGLCVEDYRDLEAAIDALPLNHRCAVTRAYKPWTAQQIEQEWPARHPEVWRRWLTAAAQAIVAHMNRTRGS